MIHGISFCILRFSVYLSVLQFYRKLQHIYTYNNLFFFLPDVPPPAHMRLIVYTHHPSAKILIIKAFQIFYMYAHHIDSLKKAVDIDL